MGKSFWRNIYRWEIEGKYKNNCYFDMKLEKPEKIYLLALHMPINI